MTEITIESEYIKLDQFLKLAEIASTGGHAKFLIQEGLVTVNDEIELRRGKKIKSGDIVEIDSIRYKVELTHLLDDYFNEYEIVVTKDV